MKPTGSIRPASSELSDQHAAKRLSAESVLSDDDGENFNSETIDTVALDRIWELCPATGKTFEESLIESGVISSRELAESYSRQYLLPFFDPPGNQPPPVDPSVGALLPGRICFDAMMAPLADDGTSLDVAIVSPETLKARDEVLRLTGRQMRPLFASLEVVENILAMLYGDRGEDPHQIRDRQAIGLPTTESEEAADRRQRQAKDYIVQLFEQALERRATDIYIDPIDERWRVRMRISGSLVPLISPDPSLLPAIEYQLKKLARLDAQPNQQPQEGNIQLRHGRRSATIKLLTCPSIAGETFVFKIRGRESTLRSLTELGLRNDQFAKVVEALEGPAGLILVVGPPASGKRSTLYACVQYLNRDNRILCTVEEAIRVQLSGVNQFPARPEYGLSYQDTVRAVLNRDPDVLMLSDLRDAATAEAAFRAAADRRQTLVAVTAEGAAAALNKLTAMGISNRNLNELTSLVIGQRMLRRQCAMCRTEQTYNVQTLKRWGLSKEDELLLCKYLTDENLTEIRGYESQGCQVCRGTGFRGGIVLFDEVFLGSEITEQSLCGMLASPGCSTARCNRLSRAAIENVVTGNVRLKDVLSIAKKQW